MTMTSRIVRSWGVVALLVLGLWVQSDFAQGASAPSGWTTFTSKAMGFSVLMPGTPKQVSLGKKAGVAESFALPAGKKGDVLYLIIVGDYAAAGLSQAMAKTPADTILDKMRDGYVKGSKGKLVSEKKITSQGYPGRQMDVAMSQSGTLARVQLLYANNRMYQLSLAAPEKVYPKQDAQRFFSSLKVMKR